MFALHCMNFQAWDEKLRCLIGNHPNAKLRRSREKTSEKIRQNVANAPLFAALWSN